jgi:hypothetical protein
VTVDNTKYWATLEGTDFVDAASDRFRRYREELAKTGRAERMTRAWSCYYGAGVDGQKSSARLLPGGEQGEMTIVAPPLFGTLARQTMRLLCGQKPTFKTRPINSDSESLVEAIFGDQLLDAYDRNVGLAKREEEATLGGILLGASYNVLSWDTALGQVTAVDPNTNKEYREGDVTARYFTPWDVAFDSKDADEESRQWFAFRRRFKRFDLIAQYPKMTAELLKQGRTADRDVDASWSTLLDRPWRAEVDSADPDNVWVWEVRHIPTAALPQGRLVRFVSRDCVLYDSAKAETADGAETNAGYPYAGLHAYEFAPETVLGSGMGHTSHFDILGLQEAVEAMVTAGMTNINMGAVTNWWVRPGSQPNVQRLSTGANIIESETKPETIDGVQISEAMMGFLEVVRRFMQEAVGSNDVTMGETPKGMPAQLAALLEAKAVQYHQSGQAAYYRLVERSRTGVLEILKRFVTSARVTQLIGKAGEWASREWSKDNIQRISRVVVEPVNPMMKTFAGRMAMLEQLGADMEPDAKMSLMLTGSLEEKLDGPKAREGRIAKEKDLLRQGIGMPPLDLQASMMAGQPVFLPVPGEFVRPIATDPHWLDIPEYLSVIASPLSRADPRCVEAVLSLVEEKLRLWRNMSLDLIMLLGGQPAPTTTMLGPAMPKPPMAPPPSDASKEPKQVTGDAATKLPKPPPNPINGTQSDAPVMPPVPS